MINKYVMNMIEKDKKMYSIDENQIRKKIDSP